MPSFWLAMALVFVVAAIAGAIASIAGARCRKPADAARRLYVDIKVAVAVVSIPHFIGTALRHWMLHEHVDWRVLRSFGLTSAAGGLAGAYLGTFLSSPLLTGVLGVLLFWRGANRDCLPVGENLRGSHPSPTGPGC